MSTAGELFTIGQLATRTGVPTRTIRFWSDAGLVPPASWSGSGYRLYDAEAAARLDLVRTLRELGFGLDVVQAVLSRTRTVAEVAAAHVAVLDTQIRALRLRRAVLSTVARHGHTIEETLIMHKLAQLSARERQQLIDDFVDGVFAGTDPGAPGAGIASGMRQLPADLPDDPAPEQVNAWIELAELVTDEDFRQRARSMALAGQQGTTASGQAKAASPGEDANPAGGTSQPDYQAVIQHAGQAAAQSIAPGSAEGQAVLDRIVTPGIPAAQRSAILRQLETFTDARVERYWQLLAILNGQPAPPSAVPAFEWLIAALRAGLDGQPEVSQG
ncbi:MAG TPA: MerR family transcriptional regulator [Streptosporangiaceae bacterium]